MKLAKSKLNKEWHEKNRMPRNASSGQRMQWHLEHSKNCNCRPIPESLREKIKKKLYRKTR
jgi:hypothetical protein